MNGVQLGCSRAGGGFTMPSIDQSPTLCYSGGLWTISNNRRIRFSRSWLPSEMSLMAFISHLDISARYEHVTIESLGLEYWKTSETDFGTILCSSLNFRRSHMKLFHSDIAGSRVHHWCAQNWGLWLSLLFEGFSSWCHGLSLWNALQEYVSA